ncbi:hypothetical protein J5N97_003939 [Dioscorea zingiberensis]|uniref:Uncharacterized protein n=1 Tax=Dioscorea zingiberensis TaxID=325984 RepID=A0A9D5D7I2_9LILI|nr:hypothetical protein J5N97_003939 [Dioscorea zingiberensis]
MSLTGRCTPPSEVLQIRYRSSTPRPCTIRSSPTRPASVTLLEKLYQWILRQHEEGLRVSVADIVAHLQNEINCGGEDITSPKIPSQHQQLQTAPHNTNACTQMASCFIGQEAGSVARTNNLSHQAKSTIFSKALYGPIHRSLQTYVHSQGGEYYPNDLAPTPNGTRNHEANSLGQIRETNDNSMDMY